AGALEPNGGFLLGGTAWRGDRRLAPLPTRDALLPILVLLAEAAGRRRPLSALTAALPARITASARLENVAETRSRALLTRLGGSPAARDRLAQRVAGVGVAAVDTLDGLRMTLSSGEVLHLRPSGNAPELRCYAEAATAERAAALASGALAAVAA
ncbi:MAG TPA: phosphomannomutase, partial [Amaricoccus sp.]|nr:phosphomannomutase [Amaricoccus sp.]